MRRTNDSRWIINENHIVATDGVVGSVVEKDGIGYVTATNPSVANPSQTTLTYDANGNGIDDESYTYKTTMENNASTWLIYDKDDATGNTANNNSFSAEFFDNLAGWSGVHDTNTTTKDPTTVKTNRRSMW
jgi:hypothetical protein